MEYNLSTDGLFHNADSGFDAKSFRGALVEHGIIVNVCPNPRNAESIEIISLMRNFIRNVS